MNRVRNARLLALTLLALSAFWGFTNGPREIGAGETLLQRAVGGAQLLYALAALATILALWLRPHAAQRLAAVWGAALTLTATLAVFAWSARPWEAVLAIAFFAAVGRIVVWLVGKGVQPATHENEAH